MRRLLLFGGTTEGRELALAAANLGWQVTLCVATDYGAECVPEADGITIHTGRLDEAAMEALMGDGFTVAVDATHPYAVAVSANIRAAAEKTGLPLWRLLRAESEHPDCRYADSVAEACTMVPEGNVLAATGSKEIAAYTVIPDYQNRVYARVLPLESSLNDCHKAGLDDGHILAAKGPFSLETNMETMERYHICSMITKDGGAAGGFPEKLEAARRCGVAVILVRRPVEDGSTMEEILKRLEARA